MSQEQTFEICLLAMRINAKAMKYVKEHLYDDVMIRALRENLF